MVASDTTKQSDRVTSGPEPAGGVAAVGHRFREMVAFGGYYAAAQLDRIKLTAINVAMFAVLGLMATAIGVAVVFTAAVLLVVGLSGAVGQLFGPRFFWLGFATLPLLVVLVLLIGVVVGFKIVTKSTRGKLAASYEQRKRDQRSSLGTDVQEQSR